MRKIIIHALFIMISFKGMSQDAQLEIDNYYVELHSALKNSEADSARVKNLNNLAGYHKFSRPDSGVYYATLGFELAREIEDKEQELIAIESLATAHQASRNSVTAYRVALEGLRKAEEYDSDIKGYFYRILGIIMRSSQNFEASLEYYRKAKSEFYRINQQSALVSIYAALGVIHSELGNIDSAFYYGYQAVALAESLNSNAAKDFAYNRIGTTYLNIQNLDSALHYYKRSNSIRTQSRRTPNVLQKIAHLYTLKEQPDSALYYAEESLNLALTNRLYESVSEIALFFSDFYEKTDPSKALQYTRMALAYKDSLDYMSKMTGFADLTNFDELQRQAELEKANEAYQTKLRTYAFVGSIFILMIIALFLFRSNRAKHKSKLQIEGAYHQLKSTQAQLIQSEKMASLGELTAGIAHEIQNPLNFVNNFSEVSKELIFEMKEELAVGSLQSAVEIADDISQNLEKIHHHGKRADAIVKGMLQHSRTSSGQKELTDINTLCDEYLRLAYHGMKARDKTFNANLKTDFDENIGMIHIIPQDIGRVLLNLINNALYAVDEKKGKLGDDFEPTVSVSTKQHKDTITIAVSDNGNGIPESIKEKIFQPFFTTKPTGQGTGLGLSLSYDIVKAHGGEIKVNTKENEGTEFTIQLPII
jgi:two-component system, NtrC family, sensor kinase